MNKKEREIGLRAWIAEVEKEKAETLDALAFLNPITNKGEADLDTYIRRIEHLESQIRILNGFIR